MTQAESRSRRPLRLGSLEVVPGPIAYGCWRFAGTDVRAGADKIETAVEVGMTLIDTADVYGLGPAANFGDSELLLGEVLSEAAGLRDRIILATKGGIDPGVPYHTSKRHMLQACEDSLRRLGVETIDLYQVHRPDFLTHPDELAEALTTLRESGKVREVGVSNYSVSQYRGLRSCLSFPIVSRQPEFSAWHLDPLFDGVLDQCMEEKLTVLAWSPLAGGLLANAGGSAPPGSEQRLAGLLKCLDALAVKRRMLTGDDRAGVRPRSSGRNCADHRDPTARSNSDRGRGGRLRIDACPVVSDSSGRTG